jgi:iron complex transport system substrate-binding protein
MRVLSLLPAATEIVATLGALDRLVGVTHECDYPPEVARLPRVTRSAVDAAATPGAIDAAVREHVGAGRPLYELAEEEIRALAPDVIVTQAVCEVCAVSEHHVRALAARLRPAPRVVTVSATTLDGIFRDVATLADALGLTDRWQALSRALEARLADVHRTLKAARAHRPRVAVVEWTDPVYAAGHWVPEMVYRAGGADALATAGEPSRAVGVDALAAANPDVVVIAPCGYALERAVDEAQSLLGRDDWQWLRGRAVFAIDARALVSRPAPRVVDGIESFARMFHPGLFAPLREEQGEVISV